VAGKILGQQVALQRAAVFSYITPRRRRFSPQGLNIEGLKYRDS